jgi:endonuclease YncB( thermonuclease family)
VVRVADGDTITVLRDRQQIRIRLDGIDCPEGGQAFGTRAKQFTSELVFGREVTISPRDTDRYGRTVARVFVDQGDVSLAILKAGFGWHYKKYSSDPVLAQAKINARNAKSGLWADPHAVAPWEFRHPPPGMQLLASVGSFHGNLRTRVFHAPGCQHYDCPNCRQPFASIEEAERAGFHRHAACVR